MQQRVQHSKTVQVRPLSIFIRKVIVFMSVASMVRKCVRVICFSNHVQDHKRRKERAAKMNKADQKEIDDMKDMEIQVKQRKLNITLRHRIQFFLHKFGIVITNALARVCPFVGPQPQTCAFLELQAVVVCFTGDGGWPGQMSRLRSNLQKQSLHGNAPQVQARRGDSLS